MYFNKLHLIEKGKRTKNLLINSFLLANNININFCNKN